MFWVGYYTLHLQAMVLGVSRGTELIAKANYKDSENYNVIRASVRNLEMGITLSC